MFVQALISARRAGLSLIAAGAGLAVAVLPAKADRYDPYAPPGDWQARDVTIYAPPPYVRQPTTRAMVRLDSVSLAVPLGDLDLSTPLGAYVAKARIQAAAREACDQAEDRYPTDVSLPDGCYMRAVRQGLAQAQRIAGYPILAWGYR
jgi:UrcA family protein